MKHMHKISAHVQYEAQWKKVIHVAMDYIAGKMHEQGAKSGKVGISMELLGTENLGIIVVEPDIQNNALMMLMLKIIRRDSDYCMMHFIKTGTHEEILAYLEDAEHVDELYMSASELSDKIDDRLD